MNHALNFILAGQWAIWPESLQQILSIAQRVNGDPEAVEARLGRPLENTQAVEMRGTVAVLPVRGPIFRYANLFTRISGATSLEVLARDFTAALENEQVERIVLSVDSPGGQASGISELAAMIRRADKPVTAYIDGAGASAAYWLAAAADSVVVSETALVGSIGMVATYRPNDDGEIRIVSSQSPHKQADPRTDEGRSEVQRVVDDLADVFIAQLADFRNVSTEHIQSEFGRGGLLVGAYAVTAGMADRLGSLEGVISGPSVTQGDTRNARNVERSDITTAEGVVPHDTLSQQTITPVEPRQLTEEELMSAQAELLETKCRDGQLDGHAVETSVRELWSSSQEFRAEFTSLEAALAYYKALSDGRVKQLVDQPGMVSRESA